MTEAWIFAAVDSFVTQIPDDQRGRLSAGRGGGGFLGGSGGCLVFKRTLNCAVVLL